MNFKFQIPNFKTPIRKYPNFVKPQFVKTQFVKTQFVKTQISISNPQYPQFQIPNLGIWESDNLANAEPEVGTGGRNRRSEPEHRILDDPFLSGPESNGKW